MPSKPRTCSAFVIDQDDTWNQLSSPASRVTTIAPGAAADLRSAPALVVVNLGAPGALSAVAELQRHTRVWACLGTPASDRVLPLGEVVVALPGHEVTTLKAVRPHSKRRRPTVLIAGGEIDPAMALWAALTREALSVSIAWDRLQVIDLLDLVMPDAVVLGVGGIVRGGASFVEQLAGLPQTPTLVLVPGETTDALAKALHAVGPRRTGLSRPDALQRLVQRAQASAAVPGTEVAA